MIVFVFKMMILNLKWWMAQDPEAQAALEDSVKAMKLELDGAF